MEVDAYISFGYCTTEPHLKTIDKKIFQKERSRDQMILRQQRLPCKNIGTLLNVHLYSYTVAHLNIVCSNSQMNSPLSWLSAIGFHPEYGPQRTGSYRSRSTRACPASEWNMFFPPWIKDVKAVRKVSMLPWPGAKLCLVGFSGLVPSVNNGWWGYVLKLIWWVMTKDEHA